MLHVFVTICFLAGDLSGLCLAERSDRTALTFRSDGECRDYFDRVGADSMVIREGAIELRFRCAAES